MFCIRPNFEATCLTSLALGFTLRCRVMRRGSWMFQSRPARHPGYLRRQGAIQGARDNKDSGKRTRDCEALTGKGNRHSSRREDGCIYYNIRGTTYETTRIYFFTLKSSFVSSPVTTKRSVRNICIIFRSKAYHSITNFEHQA